MKLMNKAEMKKKMMRALASYVWRNENLSLKNVMAMYYDDFTDWTEADLKRWEMVEDELSIEFFRRSGEK
tara:strand:+ start:627 stop:836 length:210 start_codon:yes stop_codon:yes gene_type:complete